MSGGQASIVSGERKSAYFPRQNVETPRYPSATTFCHQGQAIARRLTFLARDFQRTYRQALHRPFVVELFTFGLFIRYPVLVEEPATTVTSSGLPTSANVVRPIHGTAPHRWICDTSCRAPASSIAAWAQAQVVPRRPRSYCVTAYRIEYRDYPSEIQNQKITPGSLRRAGRAPLDASSSTAEARDGSYCRLLSLLVTGLPGALPKR